MIVLCASRCQPRSLPVIFPATFPQTSLRGIPLELIDELDFIGDREFASSASVRQRRTYTSTCMRIHPYSLTGSRCGREHIPPIHYPHSPSRHSIPESRSFASHWSSFCLCSPSFLVFFKRLVTPLAHTWTGVVIPPSTKQAGLVSTQQPLYVVGLDNRNIPPPLQ
jgi:hypothetical protein